VSQADVTETSRKIEEGRRSGAAKLAKPSATASAAGSNRGFRAVVTTAG
jgi:hypothetical protein